MSIHVHCADLDEVPEGDWFCKECVGKHVEVVDLVHRRSGPHYRVLELPARTEVVVAEHLVPSEALKLFRGSGRGARRQNRRTRSMSGV